MNASRFVKDSKKAPDRKIRCLSLFRINNRP